MGCIKYEVWIDGVCVAKEVELETAFDICKAYQNKYYNETEFEFIIKTANADAEQTEPQTCEECEHWNDTKDGCADRHGCKHEPQTGCPKTCPSIDICTKDDTDCTWK